MLLQEQFTIRRVGFWPRALATVFDLLLLVAFAGLVFLVLKPDASLPGPVYKDVLAQAEYTTGIIAAFAWVAMTLLEVFFAATPGKMISRLEIANANATQAQPRTLWRRWLAKDAPATLLWPLVAITQSRTLSIVAAVASGLVALESLAALSQSRRAAHDLLAGTAVYLSLNVLVPLAPQKRASAEA
jgi:uncharacterized RDD family membrane protein YckC